MTTLISKSMKQKILRLYKSDHLIGRSAKYLFDKVPYSFFKSRNYISNIKELKHFEGLSESEIVKWKYNMLSKVIENAYYHSPFYSNLYKSNNFHPDEFRTLEDISKIPTISKQDITKNTDDLICKNYNKKNLIPSFSGGSSASPLKIYIEKDQADREASYFEYIYGKYGYRYGKDKCIIIKGDKIANIQNDKLVLSKIKPILKTLIFDSDYLNKLEYLDTYLTDIEDFESDVLFGYPSSIYQLARSIKASGKKPPHFRLILLASENTYDDQNQFIKDTFGAEDLFFHYGHSEQVIAAYKVNISNELAFIPSYGHVELLKNNKNIFGMDDSSIGELVGTNYSMGYPLIRYRTNDFAINSTKKKSMFNDQLVVNSIEGRLQEFIVTSDKRLVSLCSIAGAHLKSISKALDTQYMQKEPGQITLNIVENKNNPFTENDILEIKKELDEKLEHTVKTSIKIVNKILKLPSNKKSMISQSLNINDYAL